MKIDIMGVICCDEHDDTREQFLEADIFSFIRRSTIILFISHEI